MALALPRSNHTPIGVDFGADTLKLLQISPGDRPQLIASAQESIPEEARQNPSLRQQFFLESIRKLIRANPFKGKRVICSVPAYQTLTQHIQISRNEGDDIDSQIAQHLRSRMNVDPSRMVIRHFPIAATHAQPNRQEVMCLAAGRDTVMQHINTLNAAKLQVVGMHAEPHAILKAFAHLYRRAEDAKRTTCFVDIGAVTTKVVIAHGQELVFAKTLHSAGDHLTRAFAEAHGVSFNEARQRRIDEAAVDMQPQAAAPEPEPEPEPVLAASARQPSGFALLDAQVAAERPQAAPAPTPARNDPAASADADMAEALDCLIDELQLCIRYHQSLFRDRPVERLVFLGGEAGQVRNCQRIAKGLRIAAQLGDPLARLNKTRSRGNLSLDLRKPQPGWAVPLGLCLSEANL